ncbi:MAG: 3-oxoadipate enol-lactonase [Planctomycetes bacterium]|jgi:pimeloyl-ACP methyl ester carboxylesterase|nr:3-oxoadipate enol-lactonase [Planctomycetota bacterium]HJM58583.1 alpha/beta hydrolase [Planctomycetota bacterium]
MPTTTINSATINYEVDGEGHWLILLHGFGSSLGDWEEHRPIFAKSFRVLSLDFRGFGESSRDVGPFSVPQMAQDLKALMDQLEIRRAHMVGYSMGGAVALELGVAQPQRLDRLILVNTWASFQVTTWARKRELVMRRLVVRWLSLNVMGKILGKRLFGKPGQEELRHTFVERYKLNSKSVYLALLETLPKWNVMAQLERITCPTLVLSAEHDYTPLEEKQAYACLLPDATLEIMEGTGHGAPYERPEWFGQRICRFLVSPP